MDILIFNKTHTLEEKNRCEQLKQFIIDNIKDAQVFYYRSKTYNGIVHHCEVLIIDIESFTEDELNEINERITKGRFGNPIIFDMYNKNKYFTLPSTEYIKNCVINPIGNDDDRVPFALYTNYLDGKQLGHSIKQSFIEVLKKATARSDDGNIKDKLKALGWIHENDEWHNGNRYVTVDEEYIDIYTWNDGEKDTSYLTKEEFELFYKLILKGSK